MHACLLAAALPSPATVPPRRLFPITAARSGRLPPCPLCLQGQLLAGWLEYQRKNTWACVTWLTYSGYWMG